MALWTSDQVIGFKHAWDASKTEDITESSGDVSQIEDQYGTEHMVQPTGAEQPKTGTDTINSLNVLKCEDLDNLEKDTFPIPSSGDVGIFSVYEFISAVTGTAMWSLNATNDVQYVPSSTSQFEGEFKAAGIGSDKLLTGFPFNLSVHAGIFDFAGAGLYNMYVDGTKRTTDTTYSTKLDTSQDLGWNKSRNNFARVTSRLAELVIIEDVTTVTRQLMEGYLAWKWGLEANLPGGHPYEFAPPFIGSATNKQSYGQNVGQEMGQH